MSEADSVLRDVTCVPLCGAAKAYGKYAKWWQHERECPARIAYVEWMKSLQRTATAERNG
jgi:hypothetical protein